MLEIGIEVELDATVIKAGDFEFDIYETYLQMTMSFKTCSNC